jgi:hypothetical protein
MRARLAGLAVVVGSTLFTLLACELGLRVVFRLQGKDIAAYREAHAYAAAETSSSRFTSHPFLPYAPRPNDSRTITIYRPETSRAYSTTYRLNSMGFRGPDLPFEKPAGVARIICLGGSTTFDGFTDAETWPARLEARLRARGLNVEVVNLGVDMAASPTSLVNLMFVGLEYSPDLVISYDGVNDTVLVGRRGGLSDYRNVYGDFDDSYRPWQGRVPRWLLERSHLATWATFRLDRGRSDLAARVMKFDGLPPSSDPLEGVRLFERNLKLMRAASKEYGAWFLAATAHWATPDAKVRAMNEELRGFYAAQGIDYLDLEATLPPGQSLHTDNVHWTREGIERVAAAFEERIVSGGLLGGR